jgi:hypothetical protein
MEVVENRISARKRKKTVIIHSILPFKDFVSLLDALFDSEYIEVKEVSKDEFENLEENDASIIHFIDKRKYDNFIKGFINNKISRRVE